MDFSFVVPLFSFCVPIMDVSLGNSSFGSIDIDGEASGGVVAAPFAVTPVACHCKGKCAKKDGKKRKGCPCRTAGQLCNVACRCGTRTSRCNNKVSSVRSIFSPLFAVWHWDAQSDEGEEVQPCRQVHCISRYTFEHTAHPIVHLEIRR